MPHCRTRPQASAPSLRQHELDQVHRVTALPYGQQNLSPLSGPPWWKSQHARHYRWLSTALTAPGALRVGTGRSAEYSGAAFLDYRYRRCALRQS